MVYPVHRRAYVRLTLYIGFLLLPLLIVVVMLPIRRSGYWVDARTYVPLQDDLAYSLDRRFFGWLPNYTIGAAWAMPTGVLPLGYKVELDDSYVCNQFRWKVDTVWVIASTVSLIVVSLGIASFIESLMRDHRD